MMITLLTGFLLYYFDASPVWWLVYIALAVLGFIKAVGAT